MKFDYAKIENQLEILLAQDVIEYWREMTAGCYRINGTLDIFPRHKKWFNAETKGRGQYKDLERFLKNVL